MAFQGFAIVAVTVGLASLLYYIFANNGAQEQGNEHRYSTSGHDPDIGRFSHHNSWEGPSNKSQPSRSRKQKKRSIKTPCKDTECTICLQKIVNAVTILPCNHGFHDRCISLWRSQGPLETCNTCPNCRNKL